MSRKANLIGNPVESEGTEREGPCDQAALPYAKWLSTVRHPRTLAAHGRMRIQPMPFRDTTLGHPRPASIRSVALPRREGFFPSPVDWRNEVLYFLLPDRFSDGQDKTRPLLDRSNLAAA